MNYSSRPKIIASSQTHLTTHKGPTTVVNRRPKNQDIYQRKKVVPGRQTYGKMIGKRSYNIVIFGDSITNVSRYYKNNFNQKFQNRKGRFKYFPGTLSRDILQIQLYINPTLEESEFDVAIIHVQV